MANLKITLTSQQPCS